MLEFIGWIGGAAFAICGLPQAIKSYTEKQKRDLQPEEKLSSQKRFFLSHPG